MQMFCDVGVAAHYTSASQRARVISECWFNENAYCLACEANSLQKSAANTIATDFTCRRCGHRYELKAFRKRPRTSLLDGAYLTLVSQIEKGLTPTFCLLERSETWKILSLTALHSSLITPWAVERRPALKESARRAGYVGCKIRLDRIPSDGEIALIESGIVHSKSEVRRKFQRFLPLSALPAEKRGWATLTLGVVRNLSKPCFSLDELYSHEDEFRVVYPRNRHVREKIRQQLQRLRDMGIVRFDGNGKYSVLS